MHFKHPGCLQRQQPPPSAVSFPRQAAIHRYRVVGAQGGFPSSRSVSLRRVDDWLWMNGNCLYY
jgi:hypothetical protein